MDKVREGGNNGVINSSTANPTNAVRKTFNGVNPVRGFMFTAAERVGFELRQEFHLNVFASKTFRQRVM